MQITVETTVAAPVDHVWRAYTTPEAITRWNAASGDWHTPVGVAATPLPRGAAQRIGVVRALVERPHVLLLDDITSQIDADSDARLARMLAELRGKMTVIIVTHRPSTLGIADRVFALRDGRLEPVS